MVTKCVDLRRGDRARGPVAPARRGMIRATVQQMGCVASAAGVCGETSAVMPAFSATDRRTAQALCLESRPPRVLTNSAGVPRPLGREPGATPDQVRIQGRPRVRADRHDAFLAALAEHPQSW